MKVKLICKVLLDDSNPASCISTSHQINSIETLPDKKVTELFTEALVQMLGDVLFMKDKEARQILAEIDHKNRTVQITVTKAEDKPDIDIH